MYVCQVIQVKMHENAVPCAKNSGTRFGKMEGHPAIHKSFRRLGFGHRSFLHNKPGRSIRSEVQQMISCSDTADGCGGGNPVDGYSRLG